MLQVQMSSSGGRWRRRAAGIGTATRAGRRRGRTASIVHHGVRSTGRRWWGRSHARGHTVDGGTRRRQRASLSAGIWCRSAAGRGRGPYERGVRRGGGAGRRRDLRQGSARQDRQGHARDKTSYHAALFCCGVGSTPFPKSARWPVRCRMFSEVPVLQDRRLGHHEADRMARPDRYGRRCARPPAHG